jgi:hypothetical protein
MTRRVLSLVDDDTAVAAQVTVERDPDGPARIVEVVISSTNGRGLRAEDLLVLEEMGLRLPTVGSPAPAVEPAATAPVEPASPVPPAKAAKPAPAKAAKAKPRKQAALSERKYRLSPPVEELDRVFRECGGSATKMAERFGVPRHTMQGWMRRHQGQGHVFDLDELPAAAVNGSVG